MIVLLTNDDGVHADGLLALREAFCQTGEWDVYVAAPDRERSASGHAITMHQPLRVDDLRTDGSPCKCIWAISGTPADCTKLAVAALLPSPPDVVVSGINRGPNLGTDVFYSGTVSAAVEAAMLGIPAIAVSLSAFENLDYSYAADFSVGLAELVAANRLPDDCLLNVNIPALEPDDITGVALTRLGNSRFRDFFEKRVDPRGKAYYWLTGELQTVDSHPDTDMGAIKSNLISVTPIHLDLTHYALIDRLKEWNIRCRGNKKPNQTV